VKTTIFGESHQLQPPPEYMNPVIQWNNDLLNIEGHLDDQAKWFRKDLAPGTAAWNRGTDNKIVDITFVCPCGCGEVVSNIPVTPGFSSCYWKWDNNETQPTLTPSIRRLDGCKWHGYLTKGIFTQC
jgi:hypothetical protein